MLVLNLQVAVQNIAIGIVDLFGSYCNYSTLTAVAHGPDSVEGLSTCMKDAYVTAFTELVSNTRTETGVELPVLVEHYVVALLADHVDKNSFLPTRSFAESLMTIRNSRTAKELGDTCLFVTGVFPNYGIDRSYYMSIGQSAYTHMDTELFNTVSVHFPTISNFIRVCVHGKDRVWDYDVGF